MKFEVKRKIGFIFVIMCVTLFLALMIYSEMVEKKTNPMTEEFYGVVSEVKRIYPSQVKFKFINQDKLYYMSGNVDGFRKSVSIGDSIAKIKNEKFLIVYKKKDGKYLAFDGFDWE